MTTTIGPQQRELVDRLEAQLNLLVNAQFESPEFRLYLETPLTPERAKYKTVQMVFYTANRRDCWAFVQARAPLDVKQAIWKHEQDELISDSRVGVDHVTLVNREAAALGVGAGELASAEPSPLLKGALMAFSYYCSTAPWLAALTASHFLERRNNNAVVRGGGETVRWRKRLVEELGLDGSQLASSNVHVVADEEHSDLIWDRISAYVVDEESYRTALAGARESALLDRAVRGAFACGMRMIDA